jgi:hypothetical protein
VGECMAGASSLIQKPALIWPETFRAVLCSCGVAKLWTECLRRIGKGGHEQVYEESMM